MSVSPPPTPGSTSQITVTAQRPKQPLVNYPQCFVEIYPFEGGTYVFTGGQQGIIRCDVEKSIDVDEPGRFTITLAPGGPKGPNTTPLWNEVITPMSLCLIGMTRGLYQTITMVGLVRSATVAEDWTGGPVQKRIIITGEDFYLFFKQTPWLSLTFLALPGAAAAATAVGLNTSQGVAFLSQAYNAATPGAFAQRYFTTIMAGAGGVLNNTQFPYNAGNVTFPDAMGYLFQEFPNVTIPFGGFFQSTGGNWSEMFHEAMPFPWYEFFVITADQGVASSQYSGVTQPKKGFTMKSLGPDIKCSPYVIGRVNPLPHLPVKASGQSATFQAIDVTAWNALKQYKPDSSYLFVEQSFDDNEVMNFYIINPTYMKTLFGDSNSSPLSFMFQFLGCFDPASIHRYGFRPLYKDTHWFNDATGSFAQQGSGGDFQTVVATLTAFLASYHEPTPNMSKGACMGPLRPDIIPGNRWTFPPFKGQGTWDFYVNAVKHSFVFGGQSSTTLTLTRGLPSTVYADSSQAGILTQAHLGNAQRKDGKLQTGVPAGLGSTLQFLNPTTINGLAPILSNNAKSLTTPQGGTGHS